VPIAGQPQTIGSPGGAQEIVVRRSLPSILRDFIMKLAAVVLVICSRTKKLSSKKRRNTHGKSLDNKVLRTICGPKIENGVYRRRYNHELEREFDSPNALNVTKTSKSKRTIFLIISYN
jgi:hypothetical protein